MRARGRNGHRWGTALAAIAAAVLSSMPAAASADDAAAARLRLADVYARRADLQAVFRASDWTALATPRAGDMRTLEDWAMRYGHKEHPAELAWYAATVPAAKGPPRALAVNAAALEPVLAPGARFDFGRVTASSVYVVDVPSREVLLARGSKTPHPTASIAKLMTALVVLDRGIPMDKGMALSAEDEVGGARLRVDVGASGTVRGFFDAMLVGSANNAAYTLARSTGLGKAEFVRAMNERAALMGLASTRFADPSGIEVDNVSTAEEIAALALEAFEAHQIKRATTTSSAALTFARQTHTVRNTNDLLTDPNNGLYVLGGKTGYLIESKWNLAVKMMDTRQKPILVVVLGSESKADSFKDAETAARWVWSNYRWQRR